MPHGTERTRGRWGLGISYCHRQPTTGGTPLETQYTQNHGLWEGEFFSQIAEHRQDNRAKTSLTKNNADPNIRVCLYGEGCD
jgi:hypothetical protein